MEKRFPVEYFPVQTHIPARWHSLRQLGGSGTGTFPLGGNGLPGVNPRRLVALVTLFIFPSYSSFSFNWCSVVIGFPPSLNNPQPCEASGLSGVLSICRNKNNNGRIGGRHWQSKLNGNLILLKCSNWLGLSVQQSSIIFQLTGQPRSQTKSQQIHLLGFEFFPPGSWIFSSIFFLLAPAARTRISLLANLSA